MRNIIISATILLLALPAFGEKLYVHLSAIDQRGRATVEMTLPLQLVKKAADLLAKADLSGHCELTIDHREFDLDDMRAIARALGDGEEAVVVMSSREELRFRRIGDQIEIVAEDDWDRVVTRVPADLFLAAFGDEKHVDFASALEMLARRGGGEILVSTGDDARVRVWIDSEKVIRGGVR